MWATIYYGNHKIKNLLTQYASKLFFLVGFIVNIFGVWISDSTPNPWENSKKEADNFGILTWEFKELLTNNLN